MSFNRKGKAVHTAPAASPTEGFSLVSNEKLLSLYSSLVRCRKAGALRGYEAGLVASAIDLGAGDSLVAPGSAISTRSVKAMFPGSRFSLFHFAAARNGNHAAPRTPPPALDLSSDQFHSILGAALAAKARKDGSITVIFSHGEPTGLWHDALEIALAHGLPIIFVNQQRRRAVPARVGRPSAKARPPVDPGLPYLPSIPVDANDLVAIYRVASEGIDRARKGRGPTLIECVPFPITAPAARNGKPASTDAVRAMENYLRGKGLFTPRMKREAVRG